MVKKTKINTELSFEVQLIEDEELEEVMGEAFSSVLINPAVTWAKFILTDDLPNGNKQRIPVEEFPNLIKTGIYMPVKMAEGEIADSHDNSKPIGVISHLKQEGHQLIAMAALWSRERPKDIDYLKKLINTGKPVNISWEILFGDAVIGDNGVADLQDTALRAATIVGMPAYKGRTPMLALAAKKWSKAYISTLPDSSFLVVEKAQEGVPAIRHFAYKDAEGNIDVSRFSVIAEEMISTSLPQNLLKSAHQKMRRLKEMMESGASLTEINTEFHEETPEVVEPTIPVEANELGTEDTKLNELEQLKEQIKVLTAELETVKADRDAALAENELLKKASTDKDTEISSLKEFKASVEAEVDKANKLDAIKAKFVENNIDKPDEYFKENGEKLLSLDTATLDFMIQELVSFSKETVAEPTQASKNGIPNLTSPKPLTDPKDIANALRGRKVK